MTLLSVGHSNHSETDFFAILERGNVETVLDVRSTPHSHRFPQFSRHALEKSCASHAIGYEYWGKSLGGRPSDPAAMINGVADYSIMAKSPAFIAAVSKLVEAAGRGRGALMCSEKEPTECHRCLLVGRALLRGRVDVEHLKVDGTIETQSEIERRIAGAGDLFVSEEVRIDEGYRKLAAKHAFRKASE